MDSTFLGVLAGFGIKLNPTNGDEAHRRLNYAMPTNVCSSCSKISGCCICSKTCQGRIAQLRTDQVSDLPIHPEARPGFAHQTLMAVNPENVARFKDVAKFLAEDPEKLKRNSPAK